MNLERLEQAINIMKRAGAVDMTSWQGGASDECATTETELHSCGNSACFAGWVAIAPEFAAVGGEHLPRSGAPIFKKYSGYKAIGKWLEIADELCKEVIELLVIGEGTVLDSTVQWLKSIGVKVEADKEPGSDYSYAYLGGWSKYKAPDVIKILEALMELEN